MKGHRKTRKGNEAPRRFKASTKNVASCRAIVKIGNQVIIFRPWIEKAGADRLNRVALSTPATVTV